MCWVVERIVWLQMRPTVDVTEWRKRSTLVQTERTVFGALTGKQPYRRAALSALVGRSRSAPRCDHAGARGDRHWRSHGSKRRSPARAFANWPTAESACSRAIPHPAACEHGIQPRAGRRSPAFVARERRRLISNLVTRGANPGTEVHVFVVEEEALVKSADRLEDRPSREQTAARQPLGIGDMLIQRHPTSRFRWPTPPA